MHPLSKHTKKTVVICKTTQANCRVAKWEKRREQVRWATHQTVGADAATTGDAEPHLHLPPLERHLVLVPDHTLLALQRGSHAHVVRTGDGVWRPSRARWELSQAASQSTTDRWHNNSENFCTSLSRLVFDTSNSFLCFLLNVKWEHARASDPN